MDKHFAHIVQGFSMRGARNQHSDPNVTMSPAIRLYRRLLGVRDFRGKHSLERGLRSVLFRAPVFPVIDGILMKLDPAEWAQAMLLRDGFLEPLTIALMKRLTRSGDTFLDIGAHLGFHSLVAAKIVGNAGRVLAMEPQPPNCAALLENSKINGFENILVLVAAAGDCNSHVTLAAQEPNDRSRLSVVLPSPNDARQKFRVPMLRLDDVIAQEKVSRVAMLKLDVEGYELEAINGLGDALHLVQNIVVEVLGTPDQISASSRTLLLNLRRSGLIFRDVKGGAWHEDRPLAENNLWASAE